MAVDLEKLLAVKAFLLGSSASRSPNKSKALAMATAAIEALSSAEDPSVRVRLAFYHLLRAEILRHDGNPVPDRDAARRLCASSDSSLYRWFMQIEEATTSRSREVGRERLLSAYGSVAQSPDAHGPKNLSRSQWRDLALRSLGEDPNSLSRRDNGFLDDVTLAAMLRKHGIGYVS